MDPKEIVSLIRSNPTDRRQAVNMLARDARLKNEIIRYVKRNSGNDDDGLMIFHDCIVAFVKKVFSNRSFIIEDDLGGYMYGMARFLWLGELKKRKRSPKTDLEESAYFIESEHQPSMQLHKAEKSEMLKKVLGVLRKNCREVLMYWAGGYTMKEIAENLNYASEGAVRKKKYECYKQLSQWLESHPRIKKILGE